MFRQIRGIEYGGKIEAVYSLDSHLSESTVDKVLEDVSEDIRSEIPSSSVDWAIELNANPYRLDIDYR